MGKTWSLPSEPYDLSWRCAALQERDYKDEPLVQGGGPRFWQPKTLVLIPAPPLAVSCNPPIRLSGWHLSPISYGTTLRLPLIGQEGWVLTRKKPIRALSWEFIPAWSQSCRRRCSVRSLWLCCSYLVNKSSVMNQPCGGWPGEETLLGLRFLCPPLPWGLTGPSWHPLWSRTLKVTQHSSYSSSPTPFTKQTLWWILLVLQEIHKVRYHPALL